MEKDEFFNQYFCDFNLQYSVIIEATGDVVFAYLLKDSTIISDVWVGNQNEQTEHGMSNELPCPLPVKYMVMPNETIKVFEPDSVEWSDTSAENIEVRICFNTPVQTVIVMNERSSIGWSNKVKIESPLAKKL